MGRVTGMIIVAIALLAVSGLPLAMPGPAVVDAQADQVGCQQIIEQALVDVMAQCTETQPGTLCGASGDVTITMESGQVAAGAGASARVGGVQSLQLAVGDGSAWPLALLALEDRFDSRKSATVIVLGPATLEFVSAAGLPDGAAFTLTTATMPLCSDLPMPGVLVQSPEASLTQLRVNETDVLVNGTALIGARSGGTLQVSALTKETILGQSGAVVFAGYTVSAAGAYAGAITPYDARHVQNLPVQALPVMQRVALPGNATVREAANLFSQPGPQHYTSTMISAGQPVSILGRDDSGDWLVVRTYAGQQAWMPVSALDVSVPVAIPVVESLPPALTRPFGAVQGHVKTSYEHNNLRAGPGEQYDIVVTVPLWTDLALYGRSPDGNWLLVETLDGERAWMNTYLVSNSTPYSLTELPLPPDLPS